MPQAMQYWAGGGAGGEGRSAFTWETEQDLIEVIVKQPEREVASYVLKQNSFPRHRYLKT